MHCVYDPSIHKGTITVYYGGQAMVKGVFAFSKRRCLPEQKVDGSSWGLL